MKEKQNLLNKILIYRIIKKLPIIKVCQTKMIANPGITM